MIQDALKYAEQNPESPYAAELKKRIETGMLDKELSEAGLQYQSGVGIVQKKSTQQSVVDVAGQIAGVSNIGKGLGQALANKQISEGLESAQTRSIDIQTNLLNTIKEKKSRGEDTTRLEAALQDLGGSIQEIGSQTSELLNQEGISGKKIAGDIIQIGSYMFPYGKAAKLAGKAVGKTAGGVASGATGGFIADIGFNLQNEESGGDIFKPGAATIIGGVLPLAGTAIGALAKGTRRAIDTEKTIGKILQAKKGQEKASEYAQKALSAIDTSGVKTYSELSTKLDDAMSEQLKKVDAELGKDPRTYSLEEFAVRTQDNAGRTITTDYVGEALKNLDELYKTTGDNTSASNIQLLAEKAKNEGLTHLDVNNIARMYSSEFGTKGFSKLGEPLTSVNAQKFQNIQSGLKDVARGGIGFGEEARQADELYSAMRKTKELVDENAAAVERLKQRVSERGIFEKLSRNAVRALDTASLGTLRGSVQAVFPSNVGLKTLNWLDIERNLEKNLKLLREADSIKEPNAFIKFLNEKIQNIKFPGDSITDETNLIPAAKKKVTEYIKNPKMGLSIEDVSAEAIVKRGLDGGDRDVMQAFVDAKLAGIGKLDKDLQFKAVKLADAMNIPEAMGTDLQLAKKFGEILDADRALSKQAFGMSASDDLIQEAKKYKSAEEFVKAQGQSVFRGGESIRNEKMTDLGISVSRDKKVAEFFSKTKTNGVVEELFIKNNAKILPFNEIPETIKSKFILIDDTLPLGEQFKNLPKTLEEAEKTLTDYARKKGFDGIDMSGFDKGVKEVVIDFENEIRILNPNVLKTKSQLEEIWKKANNK